MKIVGIIPVRLESSRLPDKALLDIEGLPMIVHTYKRAKLAKNLDEVYVATDNEKIKSVIEDVGGKVIMTSKAHKTGTDRIAEAAGNIEADIIVNIQGDEPLLNPEHIDKAVIPLIEDRKVNVAVLVTPYKYRNRNSDIKAVLDLDNNIIYSSRTDLPSESRTKINHLWKMSFIVPFRKDFLLKYAAWDPTPLETIEYNEYLRIIEHGYRIKAVKVDNAFISVDTEEDLKIVRELMKQDSLKDVYSECIFNS